MRSILLVVRRHGDGHLYLTIDTRYFRWEWPPKRHGTYIARCRGKNRKPERGNSFPPTIWSIRPACGTRLWPASGPPLARLDYGHDSSPTHSHTSTPHKILLRLFPILSHYSNFTSVAHRREARVRSGNFKFCSQDKQPAAVLQASWTPKRLTRELAQVFAKFSV